jgi:hypothetical protein
MKMTLIKYSLSRSRMLDYWWLFYSACTFCCTWNGTSVLRQLWKMRTQQKYFMNISAMCHEYFCNDVSCVFWNIAKIFMTYYKNTHDIIFSYCKNTHDIAKNIHDTLQKYWWHIVEILMTHCRITHNTLQKYS